MIYYNNGTHILCHTFNLITMCCGSQSYRFISHNTSPDLKGAIFALEFLERSSYLIFLLHQQKNFILAYLIISANVTSFGGIQSLLKFSQVVSCHIWTSQGVSASVGWFLCTSSMQISLSGLQPAKIIVFNNMQLITIAFLAFVILAFPSLD